jgi:ribonuclease D
VRVPSGEQAERRVRPAVALALAWVSQLAVELEIDAALLATRGDVNSLLAGEQSSRLATGWRAQLVGDPVRELAEGKAAIAFDGNGGLVLHHLS